MSYDHAGDLIKNFGTVGAYNFESVAKTIAPEAKRNLDQIVKCSIIRKTPEGTDEHLVLDLVPQKWEGEGILGNSHLPYCDVALS